MTAAEAAEVEVTLYERTGCHLCEDAAAGLHALARSAPVPFRLVRVDIETDPALERQHGLDIPVIAVEGRVVTRAPVDLDRVREALLALEGSRR